MVVFLSQSCGSWEAQAPADSVSGENPFPGLWKSFHCKLTGKGAREFSGISFIYTLIPFSG